MEGLIAAVQPFVGPAVFIGLMFLMHRLHGGHTGHRANEQQSGSAKRAEAAARGSHQHD